MNGLFKNMDYFPAKGVREGSCVPYLLTVSDSDTNLADET